MSQPQSAVTREHLLTVSHTTTIERIEAYRVRMPAGQQAGRHCHPGGVVGSIEAGTILFEIEGQPALTLHAGDVFYEPTGAVITCFDNASSSEDASFLAFYPLSDDQPRLTMLQP